MFSMDFWIQSGTGLVKLIFQMVVIVIPLMLIMELLKDLNILDKITGKLHWTVKIFGMTPAAVLPMLVGLVFGIAYGAGMIIQAAKEGTLSKRDLYLISLFLVINHSVIEDTILFAAIGANGLLIIIFRFIASISITWFAGKFILPAEQQPGIANQA